MPRLIEPLTGGRAIQGRTFGRVWRLWRKPWARPYAFHEYGTRCFGAGPFGAMIFDRRAKGGPK